MLRLPRDLSPELKSALLEMPADLTYQQWFEELSAIILRVFRAEDIFLAFAIHRGANDKQELMLARSSRPSVPEDFSDEVIMRWVDSKLHEYIGKSLGQRNSAISYSSFSWPYPNTFEVNAGEKIYCFPREYNLLLPFSSDLVVRQEEEPPFSGYFVIMYDSFPQLQDETVQLIITIPAFLSNLFAAYLRELKDSGDEISEKKDRRSALTRVSSRV